jgi:hypothetical protein
MSNPTPAPDINKTIMDFLLDNPGSAEAAIMTSTNFSAPVVALGLKVMLDDGALSCHTNNGIKSYYVVPEPA